MPFSRSEIAQLMHDQIYSHAVAIDNMRKPQIEAEVFDDEAGHGYDPLNRYGDRRYHLYEDAWPRYSLIHHQPE